MTRAAAYEVDEVKDIRDKALAIEMYSRQARETENERRACEIRLRAERRCGQLLAETEKAKGSREPGTNRGTTPSHDGRASKTLGDLAISYDQSSHDTRAAEPMSADIDPDPGPIARGVDMNVYQSETRCCFGAAKPSKYTAGQFGP